MRSTSLEQAKHPEQSSRSISDSAERLIFDCMHASRAVHCFRRPGLRAEEAREPHRERDDIHASGGLTYTYKCGAWKCKARSMKVHPGRSTEGSGPYLNSSYIALDVQSGASRCRAHCLAGSFEEYRKMRRTWFCIRAGLRVACAAKEASTPCL
ncbi:hypothetical protein EXIGLDRAFT_331360 [Exidia glandulosa HHB12029]|uniref:Uncharacterized protein n=1 Tax=Exidia glandulosa HHB12029 TaxID=1314781 RepID=A0A165CQZ5_EXIGL|nr:hypothetical protein EXIGLDRAFT_331360 [Exidia glandulosa HHB12029]